MPPAGVHSEWCRAAPGRSAELQDRLRVFAEERDWVKSSTPLRNLALALGGEVGELMELLQWRTDEEVRDFVATPEGELAFGDEIADVLIYAVRLASVLQLDLDRCVDRKIKANAERFGVMDR
jgi:dCTP diphosphatase